MSRYSGTQICNARLANSMTQSDLADYMDVTRYTIIRWEKAGASWDNHKFNFGRFEKLEQPDLPLECDI